MTLRKKQNKIKDSQQGNSFSEDELKQYEKLKEEISKLFILPLFSDLLPDRIKYFLYRF
jgi:hypothetical protein